MSIDPELLVKRAILDYLIDVVRDSEEFDLLNLLVRGRAPVAVASELYPYSEFDIATVSGGVRWSGGVYQITYTGLINVSFQMTDTDWLEVENRKATVPTMDAVEEMLLTYEFELSRLAHKDLGGLSVGPVTIGDYTVQEDVIQFKVEDGRAYGLDKNERTNNYENFGSLPFTVITQRIVTEA
jgi:hypothetical protein